MSPVAVDRRSKLRRSTAFRFATVVGVLALAVVGYALGSSASSPQNATASLNSGRAPLLEQQFERVVRTVSPSVVQIQTSQGLGSGVVFDRRGDIVTNAHVVGNARRFTVTLDNGNRHGATLVGTDPSNDLAMIRVSGARPPAATFADSSKVVSGQLALALGNPLGLRASVTQGIISGERQNVPEQSGVTLPSMIQTSAAINPGNSGGALVDLNGRVIGTPTLAATDPQLGNSAAPGIGFAIPSNTVRSIARQLAAGPPPSPSTHPVGQG